MRRGAPSPAEALARLRASAPEPYPAGVMLHAASLRRAPETPRRAIDAYWRAHPLRADRLARALAAETGAPPGWRWRIGSDGGLPKTFRLPPTPYREDAHRSPPGHCCICGGPAFRFGWHHDLWGDGHPNRRVRWHAACVVAWRLWRAPRGFVRPLSARQNRRCAETGRRLLRSAEIDHRIPLFRVWRDHRELGWPALLDFWGAPNLVVIARERHAEKSAEERRARASPE